MRRLALSQGDGSQDGTEPARDAIVQCPIDSDTPTSPSPAAADSIGLVHVARIDRGSGIPSEINDFGQEMHCDQSKTCEGSQMPPEGSDISPGSVTFPRSSPTCVGNSLSEDIILTPMQLSYQHGSECST